MRLARNETELIGGWVEKDGRVVAADVCRRIEVLIHTELQTVTNSGSGWEALYRSPQDGRYWELRTR
jgi:hypothetical protein